MSCESENSTIPYLINAFSVNQLSTFPARVRFEELSCEEARGLLRGGFVSAVGHEQTVALYERILGLTIPLERISISLKPGSWALLGQYRRPRLTEGTTELPLGASIHWYRIDVEDQP